MIIGLSTKNKMCFVDGSSHKPSPTAPTYQAWILYAKILGHLPFSKLSHVLPFFKNKPKYIDTICQICPASKQCRLPFPTSEIKSTKPFHLLHIDVWGPYKHATPSNCTFFITIVDDFTRYT